MSLWILCIAISMGALVAVLATALAIDRSPLGKRSNFKMLYLLAGGVFVSAVFMFYPGHWAAGEATLRGFARAVLLSFFNSMQIFGIGCEFNVVQDGLLHCPSSLNPVYQVWAAFLFVLAPVSTFGFVLSMFKNLSAKFRYLTVYRRDVYIFSELNDKSLALAKDIADKKKRAAIIFTGIADDKDNPINELQEEAKKLNAILFKKDLLSLNFKHHSKKRAIWFFTIGNNETENMNQTLRLISLYRERQNTHLYAFSTKVESQLLLGSVDKGAVKVRRINEVRSLINRELYERGGETIFGSAATEEDGSRHICAVVVGMGRHGTEMTKALAWFGQMYGYTLEVHAFDADPLAEEKFTALAPELMSPEYNGATLEGEAQYTIKIHSGVDVNTQSFAREIAALGRPTYALVALGNDDINIATAVNLRMYFARMGVDPILKAIVYSTEQKKALDGLKNYRGQEYKIDFIGDLESSYSFNSIIDSDLEEDALERHLKWGKEEEFWVYEYNYRSSCASAIHMQARIYCGMPGAGKPEAELTDEERHLVEVLEHRRWNAYMRSEGYVFSGSTDKKSRNDMAKMHQDLVEFDRLDAVTKRKDSQVGSR